MRKRILLGLCLAICLLASGCSKKTGSEDGAASAATATTNPDVGLADVPTLPPDEAPADVVDPSFYTYVALDYPEGGVSLEYPAQWVRIPGTKTICFLEPVADGDTPARFAFTKKTFDSAPSSSTKSSQLASYLKKVVAEYDSYEGSPLGTGASFLGDSDAYYATYSAVAGDITVKGYVLMAQRDKVLYVFHFRAPEDDYESFSPVLAHIRDSIVLK